MAEKKTAKKTAPQSKQAYNGYMTVDRSATIDKDKLHTIFDRSSKSIEDYLAEYQYVSNYQTYKSIGGRIDHRFRLMDLFDYIMQDAHLSSIIDSLFQQILGERYYFVDDKGEKDEAATQAIRFSWFTKLIRGILDSKPYGFTLIELGDYDHGRGTLKGIEFIERRNVAPRDGLVLERPHDQEGWDILSKDFATDYVLVDGNEGYGLLLKAAPLVIAKRYSIGSHLHNAETYGIPFIHAKSEDDTYEGKMALAEDVARAGRERIIVTGTTDSINLLQQISNDTNKIYTTLVELANSEMSKLLIGQTGTTESTTYAGSAQIMFQVYQDRIEALREFVVNIINEEFVPRLIKKGMKVLEGKTFSYSNSMEVSPEIKVKMYDVLLKYFEMPGDQIEKEFGIKVGKPKLNNNLPESMLLKKENGGKKERDADGDGEIGEGNKKIPNKGKIRRKMYRAGSGGSIEPEATINFLTRVTASVEAPVLSAIPLIEEVGAKYGEHYCSHSEVVADEEEEENDIAEHEAYLMAYIRDLYDGNHEAAIVSPEMVAITARQMIQSYELGYGVDFSKIDLYKPENAFHKSILDNIFAFAAAKQYQVFAGIAAMAGVYENNFAGFRDEALRVNKLFNLTYANVENSHAGFSGQVANFWHGIDNEDTILEYVTKGDHRVRPQHKALEGIRRRKSDPFWLHFMPPWEYGCRCWVVDTGSTNGQKLNMDRETPDPSIIPEEFRFNVGVAGKIWDRNHSYFSIGALDAAAIHLAISQAKTRLGY